MHFCSILDGPDGFCKPDIIYTFENLNGVTEFSLRHEPPTASPLSYITERKKKVFPFLKVSLK